MAQRVTLGTPGAPLTANRVTRVAAELREVGCDNVALDRIKKELGKSKEKPSSDLAGTSRTSARLTSTQASGKSCSFLHAVHHCWIRP